MTAQTTGLDGLTTHSVLCSAIDSLVSGFEDEGSDKRRADQIHAFLKAVYPYSVKALLHGDDSVVTVPKPSESLLVDGFDAEQIWAQLEPFDNIASHRYKRDVNGLGQEISLITDDMAVALDDLLNQQRPAIPQDEGERDAVMKNDPEHTLHRSLPSHSRDTQPPHPIEDDFFALKEMSMFLDEAEDEGMDIESDANDLLGKEEESETDDDDDDMDIFQDEAVLPSGAANEALKPGNEIMYSDMYGPEECPYRLDHSRDDGQHWERRKRMESRGLHHQQSQQSRVALERATTEQTIQQLENEAMEEKEWPFRGEISATDRPLNSALEVDLDHETTVRPPPEPTQEHMDGIEDMIKRRIAEHQFDDVVPRVPPPIEETVRIAELDDSKAKIGLGEMYADEYIKNAHGQVTIEEKEEKLRMKARLLFKDACSHLDALTHFHFAPRPIVDDGSMKPTMSSIRMEEAQPMGITSHSLKPPEEIYHPTTKTGEMTSTKELTKEERKQIRAKRKRSFKASKNADASKATMSIIGRKSQSLKANQRNKATMALNMDASMQHKRHSFFEQIQSHQQKKKIKHHPSIHQTSIQMKL